MSSGTSPETSPPTPQDGASPVHPHRPSPSSQRVPVETGQGRHKGRGRRRVNKQLTTASQPSLVGLTPSDWGLRGSTLTRPFYAGDLPHAGPSPLLANSSFLTGAFPGLQSVPSQGPAGSGTRSTFFVLGGPRSYATPPSPMRRMYSSSRCVILHSGRPLFSDRPSRGPPGPVLSQTSVAFAPPYLSGVTLPRFLGFLHSPTPAVYGPLSRTGLRVLLGPIFGVRSHTIIPRQLHTDDGEGTVRATTASPPSPRFLPVDGGTTSDSPT